MSSSAEDYLDWRRDDDLVIACRFIPTDQWLTTRVDPTWTVHTTKLHLLSRFMCLPPLTFQRRSQTPARRNSVDSSASSIIFAYDPDREVQDEPPFSFEMQREKTAALMDGLNRRKAEDMGMEYELLSYSNGFILDEAEMLNSYRLRPYELLEIQRTSFSVYLPRSTYALPYFDCSVHVLPDSPNARLHKPPGSSYGQVRKRRDTVGLEGMNAVARKEEERWKKRWCVIREGLLSLWSARGDAYPQDEYDLDNLVCIEGPASTSLTDTNVVTLRFRRPQREVVFKEPERNVAGCSSAVSSEMEEKGRISVVLRLPNADIHEHFLRVIHRSADPFLPPTSTFTSKTPSTAAASSAVLSPIPSPTRVKSPNYAYPQWRERLVRRATRAGRGFWSLDTDGSEDDLDMEDVIEWNNWREDLEVTREIARANDDIDSDILQMDERDELQPYRAFDQDDQEDKERMAWAVVHSPTSMRPRTQQQQQQQKPSLLQRRPTVNLSLTVSPVTAHNFAISSTTVGSMSSGTGGSACESVPKTPAHVTPPSPSPRTGVVQLVRGFSKRGVSIGVTSG